MRLQSARKETRKIFWALLLSMDDSKSTLIVVCTIGSKRSFETTCVVSPWANKQFPWCKRLKPRLKYWSGYSLSIYTYWTWTCSHPEHEMFNINTEDLHQTGYMFSGLSLIHGPSQAKTRIWIYAFPIVLRIIPKSLIRLWGCRSGTPLRICLQLDAEHGFDCTKQNRTKHVQYLP